MSIKYFNRRFSKPVAVVCIVILLSALTTALVLAQDGTGSEGDALADRGANVENYFPIQGRLTDASGNPLNGTYDMTFRLYTALTGGTAICNDTNASVPVTNGLFSTEVWGNRQDKITGQQLYLSIEVETDGEMSPRQPIHAVPYAFSLRPGAVINGAVSNGPIVHIENSATTGRGLRAYATDTTSVNYGIIGASSSPLGYGGYFYNNAGGIGLSGESDTGAAIVALGSGIIKSSAQSSMWISGNGVQPYRAADTTVINMDTIGGAKIYPGTSVSNKNVMLPITIPGPLYGQNVKVVGMDIYFQGATDLDAITAVLMRRQTGVCATSSCYVNILQDSVDHVCDVANNATGCTLHYNLTTNNTLTSTSGILYLTLEMGFSGTGTWIDLGGVRLVLEHD